MDAHKTEKEELDALERVILDPGAEAIDLSYQLLRSITSDFSYQIGSGGYGAVYKGMLPNGLCIAVKKMLGTSFSDEPYLNEVTTTMSLKHKYIVRLVGYCYETRGKLMKHERRYIMAEVRERIICLEYVPNGTLQVHTPGFSTLGWDQRFQIVKAICEALDYMHKEARLVHLDLKPDNILLDSNSMPKIFDFGSSHYIGEYDSISIDNITGTQGYIAPEMINKREVSFKSDIYSLGLIIIRLFTEVQWIEEHNAEKALTRWRERLEKERAFSSWEDKWLQAKRCLELGFSCMDTDPQKRPTELRIIQLLDEIGGSDHSVDDGNAPLTWQSGDEQPVPQCTDIQDVMQGSESKETPLDHLRGDEEPVPQGTDIPNVMQGSELKETPLDHVPDDEQPVPQGTDIPDVMQGSESKETLLDHLLVNEEQVPQCTDVPNVMQGSESKETPLDHLPGDEQPVPQGTDIPDVMEGRESKETPLDHLPGDQEPGTAKRDAQTSTRKQHTPDLVTQLPARLSSLDYLKEITGGFSEKQVIGKIGASGLVYKGIISHGGTVIAVKRLCAVQIPKQRFLQGAEVLMCLDHENIVKLVGRCHDESNKKKMFEYGEKGVIITGPEQLLCYEYMPNGSLQDFLPAGQGSQRDDWQMRYNIIKGTCKGLHYLHAGCEKSPIIHLNLNLWNVLLDEKKAPRIADTGVSWLIGENDNKDMTKTMKRPTGHMAPEYFMGQSGKLQFPTMADIYSLGVVILEIVTGQEIQDRSLIESIKDYWMKESHIQSVYATAKETDELREIKLCIDIGLQCVNLDYNKRPTSGNIIFRLNQGHESAPRASLPASTSNDIPATDHKKGKESKTIAAVSVKEKKPGFFRRHVWKK